MQSLQGYRTTESHLNSALDVGTSTGIPREPELSSLITGYGPMPKPAVKRSPCREPIYAILLLGSTKLLFVTKDVMSPKLHEFAGKIEKAEKINPIRRAVGSRVAASLTMLADTAYVWFWVMVTWLFNTYCLEPFGKMAGIDRTALIVMQIASSIPAILQAVSFAIVDISDLVQSTIAAVREQWKK